MDALVRWLGDSYGPFQMMLFRSTLALIPLYFLFRNAGGIRLVRSSRPLLQAMRIVTGFGSLLGFFCISPRMPLVDAYAISYAAPLFMVGLAAPVLGEVVGWRRWSAVAVGFIGVLVILEPWNLSVHWLCLVASAVSLIGAIPEWKWPSLGGWFWLSSLGLIGGIGQILVTRALRLAPASVLAPFDYSSIVLAVLY